MDWQTIALLSYLAILIVCFCLFKSRDRDTNVPAQIFTTIMASGPVLLVTIRLVDGAYFDPGETLLWLSAILFIACTVPGVYVLISDFCKVRARERTVSRNATPAVQTTEAS
jgi:hypothetical protein